MTEWNPTFDTLHRIIWVVIWHYSTILPLQTLLLHVGQCLKNNYEVYCQLVCSAKRIVLSSLYEWLTDIDNPLNILKINHKSTNNVGWNWMRAVGMQLHLYFNWYLTFLHNACWINILFSFIFEIKYWFIVPAQALDSRLLKKLIDFSVNISSSIAVNADMKSNG